MARKQTDTYFQEKFDLALRVYIGKKIESITETYPRNLLTLLSYKLEHKEMLTEFESIVLISLTLEMMKEVLYGKKEN